MQVLYKLRITWKSFSHVYDMNVGARTDIVECSSDLFCSESALPLAKALKKCIHLQKLVMCGNYKSRKTTKVITNILKRATNLQDVWIMEGNMTSACAAALVKGLQNCKRLHRLYISNVDLSLDGTLALGGALECFDSLEVLKLLHCGISPEGAAAIAAKWKTNNSVILHIQHNKLGCKSSSKENLYL